MLKQILTYTKPYKKRVISIALLIVLMALISQIEPFILKNITDIITQNQRQEINSLFILLIILVFVKLIHKLINRFSWYLTNTFTVQLESHLKQIGFNHLMNLSLSFYNEQETGKVMSKLDRGVNRIVSIINSSGMHFLPSLTTALISFSIVIYYEWKIGLITLLVFAPYIYINNWRFQKNNVLEKKEYKLYDRQYSHFFEVLSSMELIKAFRAENYEKKRLKKFFQKYFSLRRNMEINTNKAVIGDVILEIGMWAMYAYIAYIAFQNQISIGTMMLLISLIALIRQPLWQLNWVFWDIKRAQIGAKDFFKIIKVKPTITDPKNPKTIAKLKGTIKFNKVSFTYKNETHNYFKKPFEEDHTIRENTQVFDQASFTINAGKTTALVGPSGAGKTTIASLIMRFYDPDEGQIYLDDIDLKQLKQSNLRSYIGLVSQDAYLFATSIKENMKYAKPDATDEQIWHACRLAYADKFIQRLPKKIETKIGERGVKLSGGQRQRLSLARTILLNPKIIILDEATSALDSESELYIQKALQNLLKNKTAVIIAHRLSTIQRADKIIVLKDKKVLEQGTHQELLKQDGLYSSLFKIQSGDLDKLKEWDLIS